MCYVIIKTFYRDLNHRLPRTGSLHCRSCLKNQNSDVHMSYLRLPLYPPVLADARAAPFSVDKIIHTCNTLCQKMKYPSIDLKYLPDDVSLSAQTLHRTIKDQEDKAA